MPTQPPNHPHQPNTEWRHHKQAFLHMRDGLAFFGSFGLAKSFALWRLNARRSLHSRCARQLERRLLLAQPTFSGPLLEAAGLLERVRGVRAAHVQPSRRYTLEEWGEQQAAWRASHAQPELDGAAAALTHVAEQVCGRVEAAAAAMLAEVKPSELTDRIGVSACPVGAGAGRAPGTCSSRPLPPA